MVVRGGLKLAGFGVGIGIVAALVSTRYLASMLYGIKPTDPPTFATVALLLIGVALLASYIPARQATKVDPMVEIRYDYPAYAISTKNCDWASFTVPKRTGRP